MRRPKNPSLISSRDAGGDAESPGTRGVTRRSFLTNVATAGIAATASPLFRAAPRTTDLPASPAVSVGAVAAELDRDLEVALKSPFPAPEDALTNVYAAGAVEAESSILRRLT